MEILRTSGESVLVFQAAEPLCLRVVNLREDEWLELYMESIPYNSDKA